MKLTRVLSMAMLLLLPAAIIPACAQEHEQEKQPEQKQQPAKPAQHQQQHARPASKPQQAQHEEHAKPAQQPQHAATRPQAKPAQQQQHGQQQASRGSKTAGAHGSIPEAKFRASFGSGHTFHVNRSQFANGGGRFQYGGFWFNVLNPWPVGWLYTDAVYVDYLNGGYFLCDPVHPGVYISINIG
jgi:hypothetical protein